jgi:hypothetical protein
VGGGGALGPSGLTIRGAGNAPSARSELSKWLTPVRAHAPRPQPACADDRPAANSGFVFRLRGRKAQGWSDALAPDRSNALLDGMDSTSCLPKEKTDGYAGHQQHGKVRWVSLCSPSSFTRSCVIHGRLSQICERAIYLMIADKGRTTGDPALGFVRSSRSLTCASHSTGNLPSLTARDRARRIPSYRAHERCFLGYL